MDAEFSAQATHWLQENTPLSGAEAVALGTIAPALLRALPADRPLLLTLSGAPGTGKTTLSNMLVWLLDQHGPEPCQTLTLSLDDYYLGQARREQLAREVHPLLRTRGAPGTHDIGRLEQDLNTLLTPGQGTLAVPEFDKATDNPRSSDRLLRLDERPRCVILEGWMAGVPGEDPEFLQQPCNSLEANVDKDGHWRHWVNEQLETYHQLFSSYAGHHWHVAHPSWQAVLGWRWRQEESLSNPHLSSPDAVQQFLAHFERICRHMARLDTARTDLTIYLDAQHRPTLHGPTANSSTAKGRQ